MKPICLSTFHSSRCTCDVLYCLMVWIVEHGWGMCVQQDGGGVSYINNNSPLDEDGQPSLLSHATRVSPATVSPLACSLLEMSLSLMPSNSFLHPHLNGVTFPKTCASHFVFLFFVCKFLFSYPGGL